MKTIEINSIDLDKVQNLEALIEGLRAMAVAIKADSIRAQVPAGAWVCDIVVRKKK